MYNRDYRGNLIPSSPRVAVRTNNVVPTYMWRKLPYGYTVIQTYHCLKKCWTGYKIARAHETADDERLWASFIRRLQFHMGQVDLTNFECMSEEENKEGMLVCIAEKFAPELMKMDVSHLENLYYRMEQGYIDNSNEGLEEVGGL